MLSIKIKFSKMIWYRFEFSILNFKRIIYICIFSLKVFDQMMITRDTKKMKSSQKVLKAGRENLFLWSARETKAGDCYLCSRSESFIRTGEPVFEKAQNLSFYKENFKNFQEMFSEATNFIIERRRRCDFRKTR